MIIYLAINKENGMKYVGKTIHTLEQRIKGGWQKSYFGRTVLKYGIELFEFIVIDTASSYEELNEKEMFWIDEHDCLSPNGYNLTLGGDGSRGCFPGKETREKIRLAGTGRKHKPETIAKMSESAKGRKKPYLAERNKSEAMKIIAKRPRSEETKKKMAESRKAFWEKRKQDPEAFEATREKMRLSQQGHIPWNKGKKTGPLSEEHRAKISEAGKLRYAQ